MAEALALFLLALAVAGCMCVAYRARYDADSFIKACIRFAEEDL